ncbi:hypothetical protein W97_06994 [Coniosporium apollinis CBS 100218]|uniref:Cytochrome P450 n=1 Tax=Coniosporium apollinis (strain CBS 100218) TaxID=1168221 RepID=R7Z0K6_CONA1|nr:uncharacterized protein W97_06994 [Coniosporium apollinis CBS 100218]EON67740.1 hypothetical protein W97_06994 [Coniosporium apollinis CBS 100218]
MDAFYLTFKLICQLSFSHLSHLFGVAFLLLALAICTYFVTFTPLGGIEASSHGVSGSDQSVIDFLHEEHGPVVCVAPGWYSIGDPEAAAALLNAFTPKDWLFKWCSATHIHLFGWQSKLHTSFEMTKFEDIDAKPSQSSPHIQYESHLDNCITLFHAKLSECTEAVNLSHWINCLVWDAMSAVTVGQPFGFLGSDSRDVQDLIERLAKWNAEAPPHGLPAFMRRLAFLLGNLPTDPDYLESFVIAQLQQRLSHQVDTDYTDVCDVLAKCVDKAGTDGLYSIVIACAASIVASSTATAMGIKSALFHIYTNWRVLDNMRRELKAKEREGSLSDIITLQEAERLPYLQAVLKEALRMHTVSGLPPHVIETDEIIKGHEIQRGSKISISSAAIYRNKSIFGDDSSTFRPERWLAVTPERLEGMNLHLRQFGGDTLDLNLAGMVKVVPQIIRRFHVELERGVSKDDFWAVGFQNFMCKIKPGNLGVTQHYVNSGHKSHNQGDHYDQRQGQTRGRGQGRGGRGGRGFHKNSRSNQWNSSPTVAKDDTSCKPAPHPQRSSGPAPAPDAAQKLSAWHALPTELKATESALAAARWQEVLAGQPKIPNTAAIEEKFIPIKVRDETATEKAVDQKENVHL